MLNRIQKNAVQERITRCLKSGQSEGISVGNHLEGIYEETDMSPDLLLASLEELEASAQAMRRELQLAMAKIHCVNGCPFIDGEDGNLCGECHKTFCDNCFNTELGDGCKCH